MQAPQAVIQKELEIQSKRRIEAAKTVGIDTPALQDAMRSLLCREISRLGYVERAVNKNEFYAAAVYDLFRMHGIDVREFYQTLSKVIFNHRKVVFSKQGSNASN